MNKLARNLLTLMLVGSVLVVPEKPYRVVGVVGGVAGKTEFAFGPPVGAEVVIASREGRDHGVGVDGKDRHRHNNQKSAAESHDFVLL